MTIKTIFSYLKPYKKSFLTALVFVVISSLIAIFTPKILGDFITSIYDSITNNISLNTNFLYSTLIILGTLYLLSIISNYFENYLISTAAQKAIYDLKNEYNNKLSKLKISYYDTHSKGDIISRFNNDLEVISVLYIQVIPKTINYLITFIGTLIMMLIIDVTLTFITLITIPILFAISKSLLKLSKKKRLEYLQKLSYLNSIITESYLNQEIVCLYNNDKMLTDNFNKLNKDLSKTSIKAALIENFITPIASLLNYLVYLFIIVLGAKHVFEGKLKFGQIQSLIQYTKQIGTPVNNFSALLVQAQNSFLAATRILEILNEEEYLHEGKETLDKIKSIEFKNVSFAYTTRPVIENLNLTINEGEKIAIIGETGSGKTTIINLLMQFYKIKEGDILINNRSIYSYKLNSYYHQISLVPQDLSLFNDTIENNLKYGNTTVTKKEIMNICKQTNCIDFIDKLPNKLNEYINDSNQSLSEGEKQLLAISRALIKNHSLLILDEATSNVDSKTEKTIEETLKNINKNTITLIIAHKLSTITNADKIIVMKDGKITEMGTHKSLYKEKGEYYNFIQTL